MSYTVEGACHAGDGRVGGEEPDHEAFLRDTLDALEELSRLEEGPPGAVRTAQVRARVEEGVRGLARLAAEAGDRARRQEAERFQAEEMFLHVFHTAPVSMSLATLDEGRFVDVNDTFLSRLGYRRDEVVGRTSTDLGIWDEPDGRDWVLESLRLQGTPRPGRYIRTVSKEGQRRHARVFTHAVRYGGRECVLGIAEPLEERLRAEEEINRLRRFYEQVLTDLPAEVAVFDTEGRYLYLTPSALRDPEMREWLIHKTDYDFCCLTGMDVSAAYRRRGWLMQTIAAKTLCRFEEAITMNDEPPRHFIRLYNPVLDGSGQVNYVISYGVEITDLKRLENQITQAQKMEAVGRLAGGVAHDFNNLLTAIIGTTDLLLSDVDGVDPVGAGLSEIKRAAERAASLTRQLLAFSRRQVLQPAVLSLNAILSDMETILRRLIGEHVTLTMELEPSLACIKADATQIEQVVMNLAINARDAMENGGLLEIRTANVDSASSEVPSKGDASYVMLEVRDSGCGIADDVRQHIFEPFFTTKEEGRGTGLGLSTVYAVVDNAGGHITVESEPGRGSVFRIYLPKAVAAARAELPKPAETDKPSPSETILLVEDEDAVRNVVRRILEMNGYRVLLAGDGVEALEVAAREEGRIDLLLSDVVMPRMSGRELAERLRESRPETHVLFMSGHTDDATVHHVAVHQPTAFIQKPFSASSLTRKIREILDSK